LNNPIRLVDPDGREDDEFQAVLRGEDVAKQMIDNFNANTASLDKSIDAAFARFHAAGSDLLPFKAQSGSVFSIGIAGEVSPPGVYGAGGFDLNIGVDLVNLNFTGISLTTEIGAGGSSGIGASGSIRGRAWPTTTSVFGIEGTSGNVGGVFATPVGGGSVDALWTNSAVPSGGQVSFEIGGRASPITGADVMVGASETRTLIGWDRDQGFRLFGN